MSPTGSGPRFNLDSCGGMPRAPGPGGSSPDLSTRRYGSRPNSAPPTRSHPLSSRRAGAGRTIPPGNRWKTGWRRAGLVRDYGT